MAVGSLKSEADVQRFVEKLLLEKAGLVPIHRIVGLTARLDEIEARIKAIEDAP